MLNPASGHTAAHAGPVPAAIAEAYYGNTRPEIQAHVPADTRTLLDVGCAHGAFGAEIKQRLGATVWGVELHPAVAAVAATRLDRVLSQDVMAALPEIPDGFFDCITFNDVLEHLIDPESVLAAVRAKLSARGVVVASIPNVRYFQVAFDLLLRGDWDYRDHGILDRTHLRFFTKKSIRKLFASLGYDLLRQEGINPPNTPRARLIRRFLPAAFEDMQYVQFICVARPANGSPSARL